jgi:Uncharacterized protein conserved in bacteria
VGSGQVGAAGLAVAIVVGIVLLVKHPEPPHDGEQPDQVPAAAQASTYTRPPTSFEQLLMQSAGTSLEPGDGHTLTARSTEASVSIPERLSRRITLAEAGSTTSLRPVVGDLTGMTAAHGVAVYRHAHPATDIAVHVLDPAAIRIFYILTSANAPQRFDIAVDAPKGTTLALANGGVVMSRNGAPIGAASPPWAYDANGQVVPTRYSLTGNTVVLSIDHQRAGVAYPVVADPPFLVGKFGRFVGGQLRANLLQWVVGKAAGWAISKAKSNGCLTLSTFPSCVLHPFSYSWKNPAKPSSSNPQAVKVPNVVGKRLPDAHDALNAVGLTKIDYVDDTGQSRIVIQPNNWVVTGQDPASGTKVQSGTRISLKVRKPSDGQGPPDATEGTVPDVVCMNLQDAQDTLQSAGFDNLGSADALGHRYQIIDRNWIVVGQSARPGSRPSTTTRITLTVVKYGEPTGASGCKS